MRNEPIVINEFFHNLCQNVEWLCGNAADWDVFELLNNVTSPLLNSYAVRADCEVLE